MNAFTLWMGLGATLGMWRVARSAPHRQSGGWTNAALFVLFSSLVGARLFYVGMNWPYFSGHLIEILKVWLGGLSWMGASAGSGLAVIYLAVQNRAPHDRISHAAYLPLGWLGDRLYPLLPPIAITAWLGSWQGGVAYGALAPSGAWWGVPTLDETGASLLRFPLQPIAAVTLLLFFWFLETRVKPLRPDGRLSGLAVAGFLLHLLAFSLLRADPIPYWKGLRIDTWFAAFSLVCFMTLVVFNLLLLRVGKRAHLYRSERSSF